jgi:hypothetical protein
MIGKHRALPPPRNRGLPRLRILILRKSGRPDLRWGRVGEGGNPTHRSLWLTPLPALRADLPHKGGGSDAECPLAILVRAAS